MKKRDVASFAVAIFLTAILSFLIIPFAWNGLASSAEDWSSDFTPEDLPVMRLATGVLIILFFAISWIVSSLIMSAFKVDAWEKEERRESEKALNRRLKWITELVSQGFKGKRTAIIKEWGDVDTNLEYNINYFLKEFEDKIDIIDQKLNKHKALITFKLK